MASTHRDRKRIGEELTETIGTPLQLALEQSTGVPGTRITLAAEERLPADVHGHAPNVHDHKPVKLVIDPMPEMELKPAI